MGKISLDRHGPIFTRTAILRLVRDLLATELGRSRGYSVAQLGAARWEEGTRLGNDGLGLDSLERLDASGALNEFFHLHEHGAEDYLLTLPRLGDWCDLVEQSLHTGGTYLTFRTSGSTGAPKRCTHAVADLLAEVDFWIEVLGPVGRIVSMVPSHHIYGTLFTALLPDRLQVEVKSVAGSQAMLSASAGTVVVATPTMWLQVARSHSTIPVGITGISSTAPMPGALADELVARGLGRLVEIYGSSETGGVGYRTAPCDPFVLLDGWTHLGGDELMRNGADGTVRHRLMDRGVWIDESRFRLDGRRDGAVQVGGTNVFPCRVRDMLLEHEGVEEAAVRFDAMSGRLKAYIVRAPGGDEDAFIRSVDGWCGDRLCAVERPRNFTLGDALPRNPMGKLVDW